MPLHGTARRMYFTCNACAGSSAASPPKLQNFFSVLSNTEGQPSAPLPSTPLPSQVAEAQPATAGAIVAPSEAAAANARAAEAAANPLPEDSATDGSIDSGASSGTDTLADSQANSMGRSAGQRSSLRVLKLLLRPPSECLSLCWHHLPVPAAQACLSCRPDCLGESSHHVAGLANGTLKAASSPQQDAAVPALKDKRKRRDDESDAEPAEASAKHQKAAQPGTEGQTPLSETAAPPSQVAAPAPATSASGESCPSAAPGKVLVRCNSHLSSSEAGMPASACCWCCRHA